MILLKIPGLTFLSKAKFYDSIYTMPMKVWLDTHPTGDLSKLIIAGRPKPHALQEAWLKARTEHAEKFGVNDKIRQFIQLRSNLMYWTAEWGLEDSSINTFRKNKAEQDLQKFYEASDNSGFDKMYGLMELEAHRELPLETTTVYKFYNYAQILSDKLKNQDERKQSSV